MKFHKKINNSVAWVSDDSGEKFIAIGKGISFGKSFGENIDEDEIERLFKSENVDDKGKTSVDRIIENLSSDILLLTEAICTQVSSNLAISSFSDSHFLALADHLDYALKRTGEKYDYPENLRWEVKKMYPKEFEAAIDALYLVEKRTGIRLPKSEQTFLTYHFVNAQYDVGKNVQTEMLSELINRAIEIIQYHYQTILNQNSVNYIRFVTHLRYFILRQIHQEEGKVKTVDEQLIQVVQNNYRKAYQAAEKVANMLATKTNHAVSDEEIFYLTLHIERVAKREE